MFSVDKDADINFTSFHGNEVRATPNELIRAFGSPAYEDNSGYDKVNMQWVFVRNSTGEVFTLYDWKEYMRLDMDSAYMWHVGSHKIEENSEGMFKSWVEGEVVHAKKKDTVRG